jgi:hypothetical protein
MEVAFWNRKKPFPGTLPLSSSLAIVLCLRDWDLSLLLVAKLFWGCNQGRVTLSLSTPGT